MAKKIRKFLTPFGCVTFIAAFMALSSIIPFRDAWERHENAQKYVKEKFQCEWLERDSEKKEKSGFILTGLIQGKTEQLFADDKPKHNGEEERLTGDTVKVAFTALYDVWYNPGMPKKVRVLKYDAEKFVNTKKDAMIITVFGFGPLMLSLLFISIMVIYKRVNEINRKRRGG